MQVKRRKVYEQAVKIGSEQANKLVLHKTFNRFYTRVHVLLCVLNVHQQMENLNIYFTETNH